MKFLSRSLFIIFVLLGVLIAVSNAQKVQLALWPLPHVIEGPLYLLVVALLLLGTLVGFGLGWWASRHARRRAREATREAERLDREVVRLRETVAEMRPPPAAGSHMASPAAREQKAIERQTALVTPDSMPPTAARGRVP
jgi:uncharacterized integral membrane protein